MEGRHIKIIHITRDQFVLTEVFKSGDRICTIDLKPDFFRILL